MSGRSCLETLTLRCYDNFKPVIKNLPVGCRNSIISYRENRFKKKIFLFISLKKKYGRVWPYFSLKPTIKFSTIFLWSPKSNMVKKIWSQYMVTKSIWSPTYGHRKNMDTKIIFVAIFLYFFILYLYLYKVLVTIFWWPYFSFGDHIFRYQGKNTAEKT